MKYATNTGVPVERSRAEIETTLRRFGADQFVSGWDSSNAMIGFRCHSRAVRFILPLPNPQDKRFALTPGGRRERDDRARLKAWEQCCRESWRALAAVIKAKLVAVEARITTFEEEFLAHIVLAGGQTIGQHILPKLDDYKPGQLLLPHEKSKGAIT
jgi:hypothetical protein